MNLERSISNLSKRIERLDSLDGDGNDSNHWKGKAIIPLNDWIHLRTHPKSRVLLSYKQTVFDR